MQYQYRPSGVCSRQITIDVENGVVQNVSFVADVMEICRALVHWSRV